MAYRFAERRSLPRPLPRLEPGADAILGQARLGEVVAQQLRLSLGGLRELRFQHLADPPVELLPLTLDQCVVQRVLSRACLKMYVQRGGRPFGYRISACASWASSAWRVGSSPTTACRPADRSSADKSATAESHLLLNSRARTAASLANSWPPPLRARRA